MGLVRDIQAEIESRSLPKGGWASGNGSRASVETTCYGLMALHDRRGVVRDNAIDFLLRIRNRDGSWPAFDGDDAEGCWTTALALIALRFANSELTDFEKSISWLLLNKGREGHWFWRWKFKTVDRAVQFNPDKFGWPWFPGTVSWVIPTGFSLIALRQSPSYSQTVHFTNRIQLGVEMLRDRACAQGGWNAGNGIVFGATLEPHIDSTAIALLALSDNAGGHASKGLNWLRHACLNCSSVYSLAWSVIALLVHRDSTINYCVANLLRALPVKLAATSVEVLSLSVIALSAVQDIANPFQVTK